jgi:hypothetical protein
MMGIASVKTCNHNFQKKSLGKIFGGMLGQKISSVQEPVQKFSEFLLGESHYRKIPRLHIETLPDYRIRQELAGPYAVDTISRCPIMANKSIDRF